MTNLNLPETLTALFQELRKLKFDSNEKQGRAENLTDILEIVAVASGAKPAHLNGQGYRSESLFHELEEITHRHKLLTLRTPRCKHYRSRRPNFEVEITNWKDDSEAKTQLLDGGVLWIFSKSSLRESILGVVERQASAAHVLGYPECCVAYHSENAIRMSEAFVSALKKSHNAATPQQVIELMIADVAVDVMPRSVDLTAEESSFRFPYVQFFACRQCLSKSASAASRANAAMRDLAFRLSRDFGKEIWRARFEDHRKDINIARNELCPCGSGDKYKRCCE